jgi:hypothetical protein
MELAKQEVGALKFYQKISFWVGFFVCLFIGTSLLGEIIIFPHYFQYNYRFYFLRSWWADFFNWLPHFISILPIGIYVALDFLWWKIPLNMVETLFSFFVWTLSIMSIVLFRKKNNFKIISVLIIRWFLLNALGLIFTIWLQLSIST